VSDDQKRRVFLGGSPVAEAVWREQQAFDAMRDQLMAEGHTGKIVLFKEGKIVDYFVTESEAYAEGLRRFGSGVGFVIDRVEKKRTVFVYESRCSLPSVGVVGPWWDRDLETRASDMEISPFAATWPIDIESLRKLLLKFSYAEREVTLASGAKSNFYIDVKKTALTAEGHWLLGRIFLEMIARNFAWTIDAVAGVELGGCPLASAVSLTSAFSRRGLPAIYVRKQAKEHGTKSLVESGGGLGDPNPAMRIVLLEDVITTGGSSLRAIETLRTWGVSVVGVICVVDREESGSPVGFLHDPRGIKIPVWSIFTRTSLLGAEPKH
jgi:orotate phosphoribosyltransferase